MRLFALPAPQCLSLEQGHNTSVSSNVGSGPLQILYEGYAVRDKKQDLARRACQTTLALPLTIPVPAHSLALSEYLKARLPDRPEGR